MTKNMTNVGDAMSDHFPMLPGGGAYLGKGNAPQPIGGGHVLIFVFPTKDFRAAEITIYWHHATVESTAAVPVHEIPRFIRTHLNLLGVGSVEIVWEVNPTWAEGKVGTPHQRRKNPGVVYFVADEEGFIKIGHTTDLHSRIASLRTGSRQELKLLGHRPGGRADEAALHKRFAHLRKRGEWFQGAADLTSYIEEVAA